jgi:ribosome maturation factor RimP
MRYTPRAADPLFNGLEIILRGLGLELLELTVNRRKGSVQVRVVLYKPGRLGTDDCSRAHRALLPRLELAFPDLPLFVEVSSPGIDRLIKDGGEFGHYTGRGLRCYCADISDWRTGVLASSDETGIELKGKEGIMRLDYSIIAKAKLDPAVPLDAAGSLEQEV